MSAKLWPRSTVVWAIAYNSELVKNPPKSWADLTSTEYRAEADRQRDRALGRHDLDARDVRAPGAWPRTTGRSRRRPSRCCFPPMRRPPTRWCAARSSVAALLYNAIFPKLRDGAPVKVFFAPEGAPLTPFAAGIPKTAANPNAARLFLNWCLSEEGQAMMIKRDRQSHLAEEGAALSGGIRSEGRQGVGAELRGVREAAAAVARRMEQDLWVSAVSSRCSAHAREERASSSCQALGPRDPRRTSGHDAAMRARKWKVVNVRRTDRLASAQAVFGRPPGGRRRELPHRGGRDRRAARAVRLRQDHDAALHRRPRAADRRHDLDRRRRGRGAGARRARAAAPAQHRHGVPVLCGVAAHDGDAERRVPAAPPQGPARRGRPQGRTTCSSSSASPNMPRAR